MPLTRSARRLGVTLTIAAAAGGFGAASAAADPVPGAVPEIPRGMPQVVNDVLGPNDPSFWNPAVAGTRVFTPVEPGTEVICATGFVPVISCSLVGTISPVSPQRPLEFVDLPVPGGPLRVWVDVPRWGDGSTGELNERALIWWSTRQGR